MLYIYTWFPQQTKPPFSSGIFQLTFKCLAPAACAATSEARNEQSNGYGLDVLDGSGKVPWRIEAVFSVSFLENHGKKQSKVADSRQSSAKNGHNWGIFSNIYHTHPDSKSISGWWLSHPSEKYESQLSQLGWLFPIYGTIENVPNHQPVMVSSCLKPHVDLLKLPHWGIPCVLDRSRSFGAFIRSFRKPEWWIDHDSPHVRCQYRIPIIAVAKITILVAWYPLPLASEECLYLEFGNIPIVACWNP